MPISARVEKPKSQPLPTRMGRWLTAPIGNPGLIAASMIFPAPEIALTPRPLGRFRSVALLRLVDGTVWLLSMPARAWTNARLDASARLLAAQAFDPEPLETTTRRLRAGLKLLDVAVESPCLETLDAAQWGLPQTARSVVARGTDLPSAVRRTADLAARIRHVESLLHAALSKALAAFVAELDTEVLAVAKIDGAIDICRYNYLIYGPHRRYRLQLAGAFPNLLTVAASADSGTLGRDVRTVVDAGRPLVKTLARDWGVRPCVVRALMGLDPATIGQHWLSDIRTLALLLDALRPDDLPGHQPSTWQDFDTAVAVGKQLFQKPVQHSAAARWWLRECMRQLQRGSPAARARWLPSTDAGSAIRRFRETLTRALRREAVGATTNGSQAISALAERAVDQLFADLAPRGLVDVAATFEAEHARAARGIIIPRDTQGIVSGQMLLPLLPRDFVSADKNRIIRALTTEAELAKHGEALGICLAGIERFNYFTSCRYGKRFVVGIFEATTGAPVSTADIVLELADGTGGYLLKLKQHTARGNSRPSPVCKRAVAELLEYCRGPEICRHLRDGMRLFRQGKATQMARFRDQMDAQTQTADRAALQEALGTQVFEELVANTLRARQFCQGSTGTTERQ